MANRVWQYHFGRGIVPSPNNFGLQGDAPTHPELLDWLASQLIDDQWRLKGLHKLIMMSNAYQMSRAREAGLAKDPENKLLWRFKMRRLSAEEVRDSILAVNGSLNSEMFGPGIYPDHSRGSLGRPIASGQRLGRISRRIRRARRSVYIHVKRSLLTPILASFDLPDPDATCPVRFATTQPTQALGMLNSDILGREAKCLLAWSGSSRRRTWRPGRGRPGAGTAAEPDGSRSATRCGVLSSYDERA